ncbi:MAG: hypothetical protein EBR82_83080 [Caulobacteraceae bacterium]|nr:hypothetical protein [Caulobacteraceae bacterium]
MTNFNWLISFMSAYPQAEGEADVVFQVNWCCSARDADGFSATANGTVPVTYTAGAPFTPYDQLTQEQVWGWINPSIDRPEIEANLQVMIDEQKNPPVVTPPLPWAQTQGA